MDMYIYISYVLCVNVYIRYIHASLSLYIIYIYIIIIHIYIYLERETESVVMISTWKKFST